MNNINNIKTAYFGSSEFSITVLDELKSKGFLPDLIVTLPDKPQGRKMIMTPNIVKTWAINNQVECITPEKIRTPEFLEQIKNFDLHLTASYGKIIPMNVIESAKYGSLNIHPSLLPKYRGPSPLQTMILNDDSRIGVSIMLLDAEVDHGDIVAQKEITPAHWPLSFTEISDVLGKAGADLFLNILPNWISGCTPAVIQDHSQATFTQKFEKTDGELLPTDSDRQKFLKIKAFDVWPQAYTFIEHGDKKIRLIVKDAKLNQDGKLNILRVIPEGKKEMNYQDFLRGLK